jgi:hypothetical protein
MKVQADGLQLRNVGQLAQAVTLDGITVMGRLDAVSYDKNGTYALSIGRNVFHVPADHPVIIRRSAQLDALVNISDDLAAELEVDNAA